MHRKILVMLVVLLSFAGFSCQPKKSEQVIIYNDGAEPETIDPHRSTGIPEANIELQVFEGLTRLNEHTKPVPGIAEKWDVSADGLHYTFHLRDAKWSNGDTVTADDFVYAWRRALSPKLASEYAYQLYYIKNGRAYNEGKITDPLQLGVKAKDAKTLEVTLEAPTPYFLSLCGFPTLMPVDKKIVEKNPDWAAKPETYVGNGAFILKEWSHKEKMVFVKNPLYWDAENVKLARLEYTLIEEPATALAMYETGKLDYDDGVPLPEIPRLKNETGDKKLKIGNILVTGFYRFNVNRKPFTDKRVRRALAMSIDRQLIIDKVLRAGQKAAFAFVPFGIPDVDDGSDFRDAGGEYFKEDVKDAQKLLAEAGYPDGKNFPEVSLLYNTSESHKQLAEVVQQMFKKNLGIQIRLVNQEWKVYLQTVQQVNYDMARSGWVGDYIDPMTFLDMFVTDGGNNRTGWSHKGYDALIYKAKHTVDVKERMKLLHDAEKILMDEMPVMPTTFGTDPHLARDYVHDIYRSPLGFMDFKKAWVSEH